MLPICKKQDLDDGEFLVFSKYGSSAHVNRNQWNYICRLKRQKKMFELNMYIEDIADVQGIEDRKWSRRYWHKNDFKTPEELESENHKQQKSIEKEERISIPDFVEYAQEHYLS